MRLFEDKEPIRRLSVLGAFLLVITACSAHKEGGRRHVSGPPTKPTDWTIRVGPHPCTLLDLDNHLAPAATQVVTRGKHKIIWQSDAKQRLQLVFHVDPECPQPFEKMLDLQMSDSQRNRLYALIGDQNGNIAAKVLKDACPCDLANPADCETIRPTGLEKWQIKYDQYIFNADGTVVTSCDGMIIIRP